MRLAPSVAVCGILAAVTVGCDGTTGGIVLVDDGERTPYVVNGQVHQGHPSAGKLTTGSSLCTATLIGKKTVLTAAHCVSPGSTHTFTTDDGKKYTGSAYRHEKYNDYQINDDVAVVILSSEPAVAPAAINITAPTVGLEISIVGFGKTSEYNEDAGTKRIATNKISQVTSTRITIPGSSSLGNLCNGDSGGPSYATVGGVEVQVGVHSTKSGACGSGGNDMRVDVYADWISQKAGGDVVKPGSVAPPPVNPPDPPPPSPDAQAPTVTITYPANGARVQPSFTLTATATDNVGLAKLELLADGVAIASNSGSTTSFPVALKPGQHTLQLQALDAAGNKGQATVTFTVEGSAPPQPQPQPQPQPPPPQPMPTPPATKGAFGATCAGSADCESGLCAEDAGLKYCTQACSAQNACPSGASCFPAANSAMQVCGPPARGNGLGGEQQLVGSCSVARAGELAPAALVVLLGLAFALFRRRRLSARLLQAR
jgi:MYXO-CTERM domain-containing protein